MPRYVAFLRAINVGGHTVPMARLVGLFEALELTDVRTVIASGNVLFTSRTRPAMLERQLDRHLEAELGFPAEAFVRTLPELRALLAHQAFPASEVMGAHALMVGFLRRAPGEAEVDAVGRLGGTTDRLALHGRELHWLRTVPASDPKLAGALERVLGQPMTVRNVNTVRRIVDRSKEG